MSDLQGLLRQADRLPAPDLWPDIEAWEPRGPGSSLCRRLAVAALALAVAGTGIALAATAFFGSPEPRSATEPTTVHVDPRVTAEIPVGEFPQEIAVGEGAVWVTVNEGRRWYVARIDQVTNEVTDEIDVPDATDVAVGAGSIWAITFQRDFGWGVVRIDPQLRTIAQTIPLECRSPCSLSQLAATNDALWLTGSTDYPETGQVIRIDPRTNRVAARIDVPGDPRDLAVGEDGIWVYSLTHFSHNAVAGGTLFRIDPAENELTATMLPGEIPPVAGVSGPSVLTVGNGYVWTIRQVSEGPDEELVRIDPATTEVERLGILGAFHPFAVGAGGVWFRGSREQHSVLPVVISRLNGETLEVDESLGVDGLAVDAALDPTTGTVWLANYEGTATRIDLR